MTRPRFLSEDRICRGQPPSTAHVLGLLRKWVTVPDPVGQGEGGWPGGCCPSEHGSEEKGGLASPRFFLGSHGKGPTPTGWSKPDSHGREARSPVLCFGRKDNVIFEVSNNSHPCNCYPDTCQSLDVGYSVPTMKDLTFLYSLKSEPMWLGSHDIQLWAILSFQVEGAFDVGSQTLSKLGAAAGTAHLPMSLHRFSNHI